MLHRELYLNPGICDVFGLTGYCKHRIETFQGHDLCPKQTESSALKYSWHANAHSMC